MEQEEEEENRPNLPLLPFLQSLKKASKDLQHNSIFITQNPQPAIEALLHLQTQKEPISTSSSPNLPLLFSRLKTLKTTNGYGLKALLRRQLTNYRTHQLACEIEAEVQTSIDRECVRILGNLNRETENQELKGLRDFESRLLQGFDSDFQELVLRSKGFSILESLIGDSTRSSELREQSAFCIVALVRFNRDVFAGLVLMGSTAQSLISMATEGSIRALCSLIRLITIPLIDELELIGEIPKIINLINSDDLPIQVAAMDCICEIAYFARKEVVEAMVGENLIEKLMELQRSGDGDQVEVMKKMSAFASCVRRFGVQIEVGEGLSERERREFKKEILKRVRESAVSEAESASIIAEVLWGSSSA